jgi:natural product precursor
MKTNKIKLTLSKNTIANLNNSELRKFYGGVSEGGIDVPPCTDTCGTGTGTGTGGGTVDCWTEIAAITCPLPCLTDFPCETDLCL